MKLFLVDSVPRNVYSTLFAAEKLGVSVSIAEPSFAGLAASFAEQIEQANGNLSCLHNHLYDILLEQQSLDPSVVCFPVKDDSAMQLAAIRSQYPELRKMLPGPSIESTFIATFKPLTHDLISNTSEYTVVSLPQYYQMSEKEKGAYLARLSTGLPLFLKPSSGRGSVLVKPIHSAKGLEQFLNQQTRLYFSEGDDEIFKTWYAMKQHFQLYEHLKPCLPPHKSSCGPQDYPSILVEPLRVAPCTINVEVLVWKGQVTVWCMSDDIYTDAIQECQFGMAHPSVLPSVVQEELKLQTEKAAKKFVNEYGWDDSFCLFQWFSLPKPDGGFELKLMEINARLPSTQDIAYAKAHEQSLAEVYLTLILGHVTKPMEGPKPKAGNNGKPITTFSGYLTVLEGGIAGELLDYAKLKAYQTDMTNLDKAQPTIALNFDPTEAVRVPTSSGTQLGFVYTTGETMEEAMREFMIVAQDLFLPAAKTPYENCDPRLPIMPQICAKLKPFLESLVPK